MAEIFLERFVVKWIEKITVRLKSLTVIDVNSMRTEPGSRVPQLPFNWQLLPAS